MDKAIITISSKQYNIEEDAIEVVTPGKFYRRNETYYAVYDETEISGMEGTTTTLKISDNKFSLIRMGTTTTKMEFERDKKNISLYNTPYGTLEIGVDTKDLNIEMNDNGGKVYIYYEMSIIGQKSQETLLNIDIQMQ